MDAPVVRAFDAAARWFLEVSASAADRYDAPGLGEWSVRDLLGHTLGPKAALPVEAAGTNVVPQYPQRDLARPKAAPLLHCRLDQAATVSVRCY